MTRCRTIPEPARRDLTLALIVLKYTQSNSVCTARGGQTLGVGAGQQSRVHCTRLAGDKADMRLLRAHPRVLALPFREDLPRPIRENAVDRYVDSAKSLSFISISSFLMSYGSGSCIISGSYVDSSSL